MKNAPDNETLNLYNTLAELEPRLSISAQTGSDPQRRTIRRWRCESCAIVDKFYQSALKAGFYSIEKPDFGVDEGTELRARSDVYRAVVADGHCHKLCFERFAGEICSEEIVVPNEDVANRYSKFFSLVNHPGWPIEVKPASHDLFRKGLSCQSCSAVDIIYQQALEAGFSATSGPDRYLNSKGDQIYKVRVWDGHFTSLIIEHKEITHHFPSPQKPSVNSEKISSQERRNHGPLLSSVLKSFKAIGKWFVNQKKGS